MDLARGHRGLTWRTALNCNGGACVQVAASEHGVLLGNTRQPTGPVISYTPDEWHEFVTGIKQGDFDDLLNLRTAAGSADTARDAPLDVPESTV